MALTKVTGQVINDTTGLVVGVTTVGGGLSATDGFFSGIVTAVGDASFSGNVSVGGTLTYEDVTNIDAVGLVTARNGIVVGSGITLSKDGDGFFTGVVTATSYAGDGSALTGIAATDNVRTGILDVAGVGTFRNNVNIPDKILHLGDDNTSIRFPAVDTFTVETGGSERVRVDSDGHFGIGMSPSGVRLDVYSTVNDIARFSGANSGGITIRNDTANEIQIHTGSSDALIFGTDGENERLRIGTSGQLGIAGANYGTSGQFLQSQGSSSAIQWASAPAWTQESIVTKQSGLALEFTSIPSTAREIMIRFDGLSFNGSDELEFILGNSGGYVTSGYIISASYEPGGNYVKRTSSIRFNGVGSDAYTVTGRVHLWYPVHSANWWVEGVAYPQEPEGEYQHRVTGTANAGGTLTKIIAQGSAGNAFDGDGNGKIQISYLTYS